MKPLPEDPCKDPARLVRALQNGDPLAWQEACELYGEALYLYALHRCGDPDAADDIRQETLLAAVKAISRYRGEAPLFGWLCGIARHKTADVLRARQKAGLPLSQVEEEADGPPPEWASTAGSPLPDALVESRQARAALVEALWSLPAEYRTALLRRYLRGEPVETVAACLGRSYKAAESLLERARKALRHLLLENDHDRS